MPLMDTHMHAYGQHRCLWMVQNYLVIQSVLVLFSAGLSRFHKSHNCSLISEKLSASNQMLDGSLLQSEGNQRVPELLSCGQFTQVFVWEVAILFSIGFLSTLIILILHSQFSLSASFHEMCSFHTKSVRRSNSSAHRSWLAGKYIGRYVSQRTS